MQESAEVRTGTSELHGQLWVIISGHDIFHLRSDFADTIKVF